MNPHPLFRLHPLLWSIALSLLTACGYVRFVGEEADGATILGGGPGMDEVRNSAVDAAGNLYLVGIFEEEIRFGTQVHRAASRGGYVVSYDAQGAYRWSRAWSATVLTVANDVRVIGDAVHVLGYFAGQIASPGPLDSGSHQDMTVFTFDATDGSDVRATNFNSEGGNVQGKGFDANGDSLAVAGHYIGELTIGEQMLPDNPRDHGLVAMFRHDLGLRWFQLIDGADVILADVALSQNGHAYTVGTFHSGNALALGDAQGVDGVVAGYDESGALQFAHAIRSAGTDGFFGVGAGPGRLAAVGQFAGEARFPRTGGEDVVLSHHGDVDGALLVMDDAGVPLWGASIGGDGSDVLNRVVFDADGTVVVAGTFQGTITVGDTTLTSVGGSDIVVAEFSPAGEVRGALSFGGPEGERAGGLHLTRNHYVLTAAVSDGAMVGDTRLTTAGGRDVATIRLPRL